MSEAMRRLERRQLVPVLKYRVTRRSYAMHDELDGDVRKSKIMEAVA